MMEGRFPAMPDGRPSAPALDNLTTESVAPGLARIDEMDTESRLRLMNAEDARVAEAVAAEIPHIALAVQAAAASLRAGGRLIYVGAGTSGRLGVLDAVECLPTFGVPPEMVQGILAGGERAMFRSVEGAEDDPSLGGQTMIDLDITELDTVVGVSASGRSPFTIGALAEAGRRGAATVSVANNRPSEMELVASIAIAPIVGPEFIAGSTRLKSGTSQKMVLNMISTNAMVEIGKTYGNLMVDVQATNAKLKVRAAGIVAKITGAPMEDAIRALAAADGSAKVATVMVKKGCGADEARLALEEAGGLLKKALGGQL
jgi:N-acetylmuramic acid 6-phosphate etherase